MTPILTINEPKVDSVKFSPCEKYLMVYQPKNDSPYAVWNFMTCEKIRDFEQAVGEDADSYQWSYDGNYIAKITLKHTPIEKSEEQVAAEEKEVDEARKAEQDPPVFPTETTKSYLTVFELPSMKMCEDQDGYRSSIFVDGLKEFKWAPHKNVLIYTSFPEGTNVYPRISFTEIPTRRVLNVFTAKDSADLKLYIHPQGTYVAAMN